MAAYLIGHKGSLRQASMIGLSVTVTHTVGVLALGIVLSTVACTAPERIYPWLGLASGALLAAIGIALLRRASRGRAVTVSFDLIRRCRRRARAWTRRRLWAWPRAWSWPQPRWPAGRTCDADPESVVGVHARRPGGRTHDRPAATDARGLLAVGFAGGWCPVSRRWWSSWAESPGGRAWFGVLLVLAYGVGMALALVGTGLALVPARGRLELWAAARERRGGRTPAVLAVTRALLMLTASVVVVVGVWLTSRPAGHYSHRGRRM